LFLASLFLFSFTHPAAADGTPEKCAAAKAKAAGKKYVAESVCHAKALAKNQPLSVDCLTKAQDKFSKAFAKVEAKGGCSTLGDVDAIEQTVDVCLLDVVVAVTPRRCTDGTCDLGEDCISCEADCGPCESICGNGAIETGEECDGPDLGGNDCVSLGFGAGQLSCDLSCLFDLSACTGCDPLTCTALNAECGSLDDGCGNVLECGTCVVPQYCGGGGVQYQCGGNCIPATCETTGHQCGDWPDGCVGTISCGTCPLGQECLGIPAQCVAVP